MNPEFWHDRWTHNEIGFHQQQFNLHLQQHWTSLKAEYGSRVFVPLCGKSLDLLWLAGEGHRVLGVELSPIAVEAFFEENNLTPNVESFSNFTIYRLDEIEILCGDFFDLVPDDLQGVQAVYDRASLIALPPEMRALYAVHMRRLLKPGVSELLITLDYPQEEMQGPPFSVTEAEVRALYSEGFEMETIDNLDVLAENERFRERGLSRLNELVFRLRRV
ncbi:MAG: thiopurine S-methyltransferase [Gammaproteobacteria bacterium]|jgi:thiopurine S-methyltransferase